MTVDGKVMSVTERECAAIGLANGVADEEDFAIAGCEDLGCVWLAMTDVTRYRWVNGDEPNSMERQDDLGRRIEAEHETQRVRWYA